MQLVGFLFGAFVELFLEGLYYRVKYYKSKNYLGFLIGFSHYIIVRVPNFIFVQVHTKRRKFVMFSGDRHQLSIFAVFLAGLKVPNVYMGKGLKIMNEFYRQKKMLKKRSGFFRFLGVVLAIYCFFYCYIVCLIILIIGGRFFQVFLIS
jgi:hypothetical protein